MANPCPKCGKPLRTESFQRDDGFERHWYQHCTCGHTTRRRRSKKKSTCDYEREAARLMSGELDWNSASTTVLELVITQHSEMAPRAVSELARRLPRTSAQTLLSVVSETSNDPSLRALAAAALAGV